jgi:hypothetical protein
VIVNSIAEVKRRHGGDVPQDVEAALGRYPTEVQDLARAARTLILEVLPGVEETVDASAPVIGYGYGTGYKGAVCTLLLSRSGVKIGVPYGATLADSGPSAHGHGQGASLRSDSSANRSAEGCAPEAAEGGEPGRSSTTRVSLSLTRVTARVSATVP